MVQSSLWSVPRSVTWSEPALLERQNYGVCSSVPVQGLKVTTGVVFAEGCTEVIGAAGKEGGRSAGSSWTAQELVLSLFTMCSLGPAPGMSVLSQTQWAGLGSATGSQQELLIPSPRKLFIKDMRSQRRPSVTCLWAASRTRRQASDMPCRSVLPECLPAFPAPTIPTLCPCVRCKR